MGYSHLSYSPLKQPSQGDNRIAIRIEFCRPHSMSSESLKKFNIMCLNPFMVALDASLIKIALQYRTALRIDQCAEPHHGRVLFGTVTNDNSDHFVLPGEKT